MNRALKERSTKEQRQLLAREAQLRRSGAWGPWEILRFTHPVDFGHVGVFPIARRNKVFSVLDRMDFSGARHLAIASLSGIRPTWPEAQRIKNEIAGPETTAVEVYPPQSEVVDQADMYHLWVLPGRLPFTLAQRAAE
ncbi:hypothetical protein [Hoeflea sp.]|uniref:DUF7694 domain-containing protein n=1 Tax=Hoeflea sp. TaxID=1940281 RepID=UPI0019A4C78E|nr:hypothetical protein [Hoeflea sp.]MBC7282626.1 hypothetical protein [Hoeflea sp.]